MWNCVVRLYTEGTLSDELHELHTYHGKLEPINILSPTNMNIFLFTTVPSTSLCSFVLFPLHCMYLSSLHVSFVGTIRLLLFDLLRGYNATILHTHKTTLLFKKRRNKRPAICDYIYFPLPVSLCSAAFFWASPLAHS